MSEHLISSYGTLLNEDGSLREEGYSKKLPFVYDKAVVQAPFTRIKEYDLYAIDDEDYIVSIGLFKLSIITAIDVEIYNKNDKTTHFAREIFPDPIFKYLPSTHPDTGVVDWKTSKSKVKITANKTSRRLSFSINNSQDDIEVEALMDVLDEDVLINVMKFEGDKRHFHYVMRDDAMPTKGGIRIGATFHEFTDNCLSSYSWGRGAWNNTHDLWSVNGLGYQDGKRVALNLGYGIGNTTKSTQNALFIDGTIHKLEHVNIGVRQNINGEEVYDEPWIITDSNKRVNVIFTPDQSRAIDDFKFGKTFEANECLAHGTFSGSIELEDGSSFIIKDLPGTAIHAHLRLPFSKDKEIV